MIETMRFSDAPLWWRLLVLAVTAFIGWLIYVGATWAVSQMSDALVAVIGVAMFVFSGIGIVYATARDRRLGLAAPRPSQHPAMRALRFIGWAWVCVLIIGIIAVAIVQPA